MSKYTEKKLDIERQLHALRQQYYIRPTYGLKGKITALKAELSALTKANEWSKFLAQ